MSSGSVIGEALSVRFSGRAPRRVFWVSALLCSVLGWLVGWLYATLYMTTMTEITWDFVTVAVGAFQIWLALISVSISVRRLHDVGRNGLWVLPIVLVPVLGAIFWFVLGCLVGEQHENRYGPDPYATRNNLNALTTAS